MHNLALRDDGTVRAWGPNWSGQTSVPGDLGHVVAIAAGWQYSLALRDDGTVRGWGYTDYGQYNLLSGLDNNHIVAIAAGGQLNLAIVSESTPADCVAPSGLIGYARSLNGEAVGLDVQDGYAYVGEFDSGWLQVFDVRDPCHPQLLPGSVANPGEEIDDIQVQGVRAYVAADANGLRVYDISDPANPTFIGGRSDGTYANSVFYDGSRYAYTGYFYGNNHPLAIYDLAQFPAISLTAYAGTNGRNRDAYDTVVVGDRAYVFMGDGEGHYTFQVLDVAAPTAPRLLGEVLFDSTQYGSIGEVKVQGDYAYIATGASDAAHGGYKGGLLVIRVSDAAHPAIVAFRQMERASGIPWRGAGLDLAGDHAYVVGADGLYSFAIANPTSPVQDALWPFPADFGKTMGGRVKVVSDLAYVTAYGTWPDTSNGHGGLAIYRIGSGNTAPAITGPIALPEPFPRVGDTASLSASFADPDAADTHTATWDWGDGSASAGSVDEAAQAVGGSHAYQAAGSYTVRLIISDRAGASATATATLTVLPPAERLLYDEGFARGWGDQGSWDTRVATVREPTASASQALKLTYTRPWAGFRMQHAGDNWTGYGALRFALRGGASQSIPVRVWLKTTSGAEFTLGTMTAPASRWVIVELQLPTDPALGAVSELVFQEGRGRTPRQALFLDRIALLALPPSATLYDDAFTPAGRSSGRGAPQRRRWARPPPAGRRPSRSPTAMAGPASVCRAPLTTGGATGRCASPSTAARRAASRCGSG